MTQRQICLPECSPEEKRALRPALPGFRAFWMSLAAASLLAVGGCSYSQLHGYEVVHSDMRVEYEPGPMGFSTQATAGGEADGAADSFHANFAAAMRERLATAAPHFTLVADSESPPHALSVGELQRFETEAGTRLVGEVSILDRRGRATSQLRIDVTVPERGEEAGHALGDLFGARVGHYIENRENYHW